MTGPALSESLEDYLEAILETVGHKQVARAKDISYLMQVRKSSVTGALRSLAEKGLVNYAPYNLITLTSKGQSIAEEVHRKHQALRNFFIKVLAIDPETAEAGACRMEHAIPPLILERFVQFLQVRRA